MAAISFHPSNFIIMFICLSDIGVALIMVLKRRCPYEYMAKL
jgi:hypothetical protein